MLKNLEASSSPDTWPVRTAVWPRPESCRQLFATCLMNPCCREEGCPGSSVDAPVPHKSILRGSRSRPLWQQEHPAAAPHRQPHLKAKATRWRAPGGTASVQRHPPQLALNQEPTLTSPLAEMQSQLQDEEAADTRVHVARSFISAEALLAGRTERHYRFY